MTLSQFVRTKGPALFVSVSVSLLVMLTVGSIDVVLIRGLSTESLPLQWARCFNMMPRVGNHGTPVAGRPRLGPSDRQRCVVVGT